MCSQHVSRRTSSMRTCSVSLLEQGDKTQRHLNNVTPAICVSHYLPEETRERVCVCGFVCCCLSGWVIFFFCLQLSLTTGRGLGGSWNKNNRAVAFYRRGKCDQLNDIFIPMWLEQWSHNSDMLIGLLVLNHLIRAHKAQKESPRKEAQKGQHALITELMLTMNWHKYSIYRGCVFV